MEGIYKILTFIGGGVIILLVIAFGIRTYRSTQEQASAIGQQMSDKVNSALELQYTQYDAQTVSGSEVLSMIKDTYDSTEYVTVTVKTNGAAAAVTYVTGGVGTTGPGTKLAASAHSTSVATAQDKTNANYIAPNGKFLGTVSRDSNGQIVKVDFVQQP